MFLTIDGIPFYLSPSLCFLSNYLINKLLHFKCGEINKTIVIMLHYTLFSIFQHQNNNIVKINKKLK
jgi:hypothetical protein